MGTNETAFQSLCIIQVSRDHKALERLSSEANCSFRSQLLGSDFK